MATIPIAMFGWILLGFFLFKKYPQRRAVIVGFLGAWLFLPQFEYQLPGLPNYSKSSAPSYVIVAAMLMYDLERLKSFRPRWFDVPVVLFCISPFCSSISNGLGAWDGFSAMIGRSSEWLVPYFLGRIYCGTPKATRELFLGVFLGGLAYVPFCLYEIRMSPQLHAITYGYHPHSFEQSKRWGGWRPVVYMEHGLMVGMWMTMASLAGFAALSNRLLKPVAERLRTPPILLVGIVLGTTILCKSTGALGLLVLGVFIYYSGLICKTRLPFVGLLAIPVVYVILRSTGSWDVQNVIDALSRVLPERRVGSFSYRIYNENLLLDKAYQRIWFGWGGWQRSFVFDDLGRPISVPDGFWVLTFGKNGLVGLSTMLLTLILPQLFFLKRYRPSNWRKSPTQSAAYLLVLLLSLFIIDSLLNDMFNPLIVMVAGGLSTLCTGPRQAEDEDEPTETVVHSHYRPRLV